MLPILDNESMREADRATIQDLGLPSLVLMENAAVGLVDAIREGFPEARRLLILCGRGNNGGDGLAAARHLINGGLEVQVIVFADREALSEDARTNLDLAVAFGVGVQLCPGDPIPMVDQALKYNPDLIIDALLGTGLDRPLTGRLARVVERVRGNCPVVAVDVPTGLSGSTSEVFGLVLEADLTVTFGALKTCHAVAPAAPLCGLVAVVDIGIPARLLEAGSTLWWVEETDVALMLPTRPVSGHKGTFGHLLVVAGAAGSSGAAVMAARSAVIGGAGLVTAAVPSSILAIVDGAATESMTHPLPDDGTGRLDGLGDLAEVLEGKGAVAAGPGMGIGPGAVQVLEWLVQHCEVPLVLDADGLNVFAGRPEAIAPRDAETVCTPHPGELARLLGRSPEDVVQDMVSSCREAARRSDSVVVAKGYHTVICDPQGWAWVNPTGDSHLATGGSGDVLTGLIGALLAQGLPAERAAVLGTWLHGRAGELGAESWPAAVPANELPSLIARAWTELEDSLR